MADIYAANWSETDSANSSAAPDGLAEGCSPSGVNNWARATMGALKRYVNQQSPVTTSGTSTAFLVSYSVPPGALYNGAVHTVEFHTVNGAAATLNIGALGATPLHYYTAGAWRVIPTGLIGANQVFRVMYNTAAGAYRILRDRDDTGEIVAFAGATAPAGTLLCYGQAISRTDYAGLFAKIATTHGVGDGSATFNLPDMRGRVGAGLGNMGGSESGRLNSVLSSVLGNAGGAQTHTLSVAELASHVHTIGEAVMVNAGVNYGVPAQSATQSFNTGSTGSSAAHNNVQPTLVLNYLIRI